MQPLLTHIDHLVYATPSLAETVDDLEGTLGVRAAPGGAHPDWGTRNALIALGPQSYLELIGPDRNGALSSEVPFGISTLRRPRLATWAARATDLGGLTREAMRNGVDLGVVQARTRRRPDGTVLAWTMTDPLRAREGGIVPFFIDWGETAHPALGSPQGCELVDLRAEHPDPGRVGAALRGLGLGLAVTGGSSPALIATIATPRGPVQLR